MSVEFSRTKTLSSYATGASLTDVIVTVNVPVSSESVPSDTV